MIVWMRLDPLNTLYLGGNQSLFMGDVHHGSSHFPPMPYTVVGAIRTALLFQNGRRPNEFRGEGFAKDTPFGRLMGSVKQAGFDLIGPIFCWKNVPLLPIPFSVRGLKEELTGKGTLKLHQAEPSDEALQGLGMLNHLMVEQTLETLWATSTQKGDVEPLTDFLMTPAVLPLLKSTTPAEVKKIQDLDELNSICEEKPLLVSRRLLFDLEPRTGIGLEPGKRRVKTGHLFTLEHVCLRANVALLTGIACSTDDALWEALSPNGILQLGGENRVVTYSAFEWNMRLSASGNRWMALGVVSADFFEKHRPSLRAIATGKVIRTGGWEMKTDPDSRVGKGFHRPTTDWHPAGCVVWPREPHRPGVNWLQF